MFEPSPIDTLFLAMVTLLSLTIILLEMGYFANHRKTVLSVVFTVCGGMGYVMATTEDKTSFVFAAIFEDEKEGGGKTSINSNADETGKGDNRDDGRKPGKDSTGPGDGQGDSGKGADEVAVTGSAAEGEEPTVDGAADGGRPDAKKKGGKARNKKDGNDTAAEVKMDVTTKKKDSKLDLIHRDCPLCPEMVAVKPGAFELGAAQGEAGARGHEGPAVRIRIATPFYLGRYEVTRGEFARFVTASGYRASTTCVIDNVRRGGRSFLNTGYTQSDEHPVACVTLADAKAYMAWLGKVTGQRYRLPSEAEWEYAARAGTRTNYVTGERITAKDANFALALEGTRRVGSFPANDFRLHDMQGNLWELTEDCWHPSLNGHPATQAAWSDGGDCKSRVMKGGSWYNGPLYLRSAVRWSQPAKHAGNGVGFRIARDIVE